MDQGGVRLQVLFALGYHWMTGLQDDLGQQLMVRFLGSSKRKSCHVAAH